MTGHAAGDLEVSVDHVDRIIGVVAAQQDSVITWEQLRYLGLGPGAIEHRVKRGLLHRLHPGVFCWGALIESPWMRARAALYACGHGSIVTHDAACGLMDVRPHPEGAIDITVIGRRVRRAGVRGHNVAKIARADVRQIRGIPVSSPARALLEIAPRLTARELADAVEQAEVERLVTQCGIERTIERAGPRPGVAALRAVIEEPAFTRSHAERRVVSLMRAARLPRPQFNARAEGYEVDALWRRERVVLEYDSYAFHLTKAALDRDRRKTAALQRARYVVLRTTWQELTQQSHALVARTAEALARAAPAH